VTQYTGNYTFPSGKYHITGDLYFANGTIVIDAGSYFSIDGIAGAAPKKPLTVNGYSIILGPNVTVIAKEVTFNANCDQNMWRGFAFEASQTPQALLLERCGIANAMYGMRVPSGCTAAYYNLNGCRFEQNLYHVVDNSYHYTAPTNTTFCTMNGCTFFSVPGPDMLPPYGRKNGLDPWTYEALHLTPTGNKDGQPKIKLLGTTSINGAVTV
jgi:hypothetical protein